MRKFRMLIVLFLIVIFALMYFEIPVNHKEVGKMGLETSENAAEQVGISRAMVAKMLALLRYSHAEIEALPSTMTYQDTGEGKWYDIYINATLNMGITWGDTDCRPMDNITYEDLLNITHTTPEAVKAVVGVFSLQDEISSETWLMIYDALRSGVLASDIFPIGSCREIVNENLFLLSLIESNDNSWEVATSGGAYHFDGYAVDAYTNCTIHVLSDRNEIIYIHGISEAETILKNAWIVGCEGNKMNVFYAGVNISFATSAETTTDYTSTVADITISNSIVRDVIPKTDKRTDKILAVSDTGVETSQYGNIAFAPEVRVYGIYDKVTQMAVSDINVGYTASDIVIENGCVCAVLITGKVTPMNIRVALMTTGYKGHHHDSVNIVSDNGMTVATGSDVGAQVYQYAPGEEAMFAKDNQLFGFGRVKITPAEGSFLTINSIKRSYGSPRYRGTIELLLTEEGILIVNELSIEEYLYSVIPSEMPVSYGIEALKVQSVCARSYAYMQVMTNNLAKLGAHVDDSTSYQVYNNTMETAESIQAVNETAGQVLTYEDEIIPAYYFSTSCGHTANGNEVWLGMKNVPYLQGKLQIAQGADSGGVGDLSDNSAFKEFINNNVPSTFDSSFPWYRWSVTLSPSNIRKSLEASIAKRYKVNPSLILTKDETGNFVSKPIESIGKIRSIKVDTRSGGGIVTSLIIKGSECTIKVLSEYNIRLLLAPFSEGITRNDGTVATGLSLLPSAFFSVSEGTKDGKKIFAIRGGGYGHGVGMSQNGAKAMADAGYTYQQILMHYYSDLVLIKDYLSEHPQT